MTCNRKQEALVGTPIPPASSVIAIGAEGPGLWIAELTPVQRSGGHQPIRQVIRGSLQMNALTLNHLQPVVISRSMKFPLRHPALRLASFVPLSYSIEA